MRKVGRSTAAKRPETFLGAIQIKVEIKHGICYQMLLIMVGVAQLAEHQVVALRVVGSNPITHPITNKRPLLRTILQWPLSLVRP